MTLTAIITNPKVLNATLSALFVAAFALGPYTTVGALLLTFAGVTTLLAWGNILTTVNIGKKLKENESKMIKTIDKIRLEYDDETISALEIVSQHSNLATLKNHVEQLAQINDRLQTYHKVATALGVACTVVGSSLQIAATGITPTNSTTSANTDPNTLTRAGSGIFTAGFAVAAAANWLLFNKIAEQYAQSKVIKKALIEETDQLDSSQIKQQSHKHRPK